MYKYHIYLGCTYIQIKALPLWRWTTEQEQRQSGFIYPNGTPTSSSSVRTLPIIYSYLPISIIITEPAWCSPPVISSHRQDNQHIYSEPHPDGVPMPTHQYHPIPIWYLYTNFLKQNDWRKIIFYHRFDSFERMAKVSAWMYIYTYPFSSIRHSLKSATMKIHNPAQHWYRNRKESINEKLYIFLRKNLGMQTS